ncbi:hypothetical protein [Psychroserpens luteolus]|uniref:hypothetical protein n=1 Tax=Psychroserpens luteolus TaxID=2855840 RepID=UPI001E386190|nr:hypothetical protein [Psychroserpens luteolus]MCD2260199.1 hypothetical protein [Psychroserpens luteolus]
MSGQNNDRTYLAHDHSESMLYSYAVAEIIIHSDSTYTWKTWELKNKKDWEKYNLFKPKISTGKVTQKAEFYTLTEYRNGNETDFNFTVKISDRRLTFYYPNKRNKLRKTYTYKRIKKINE